MNWALTLPDARHRVRAGALHNLLGELLPLLVALWAIPTLVNVWGEARLGVLLMVFVGMGAGALLDLGLSRAVAVRVAEAAASHPRDSIQRVASMAAEALTVLGVILALLVWLLSPTFSGWLSGVDLREAEWSFRWMALALPAVLVSGAWRGVLEGRQRFGTINLIRVPAGILTYGLPVIIASMGGSVADASFAMFLLRALLVAAYWLLARSPVPAIVQGDGHISLIALLSFGGWVSVTNMVSPAFLYADRYYIGALQGAAAVTPYGAVFDVLTRLWIIPAAVAGAVLPAAAQLRVGGLGAVAQLHGNITHGLSALLLTLGVWVVALADPALPMWLGRIVGEPALPLVPVLVGAVLLNGLGQLNLVVLHATERPRAAALAHLGQLLPFLVAMGWAVELWGAWGAALVWWARSFIDTSILTALVLRTTRQSAPSLVLRQVGLIIAIGLVPGLVAVADSLALRLATAALVTGTIAVARRRFTRCSGPGARA